jgi:hypothetical protein
LEVRLTRSTTDHVYVKVLIWLIPVVFGAGGVYASLSQANTDIRKAKAEVAEARIEVRAHVAEGVGHPVTAVKLEQIETNQRQIMKEQRSNASNLAAICQATGAQCK